MTRGLTRRNALKIMGAGMALPLGILALRAIPGLPEPVRWSGETLGAVSSMTLWHADPKVARRAINQMLVEVDRLESVFSLYRDHSEITRLNLDGHLAQPSRDLVTVLDHSRKIAEASGGAFDPTIQTLWQFYSKRGLRSAGVFSAQDRAQRAAAVALIDHAAISASPREIRFDKAGLAISLNGIAQGYITDRITEILGNEGFENAVIELGETRALGATPKGEPFAIGVVDPLAPRFIAQDVLLRNAALSVSGGYGMQLDRAGTHHIFDPATGQSANRLTQVAVTSPKAVWADALSTAIYVAGEAAAPGLLAGYPNSRGILWRNDGSTVEL
jgi:FAD:protein FMN transferase